MTHGIFLKMLIAYMLYGDELSAQDYNKLSFFNPSNNAGITICEYTGGIFGSNWFAPRPRERWKLVVWDDHVDLRGKNTII